MCGEGKRDDGCGERAPCFVHLDTCRPLRGMLVFLWELIITKHIFGRRGARNMATSFCLGHICLDSTDSRTRLRGDDKVQSPPAGPCLSQMALETLKHQLLRMQRGSNQNRVVSELTTTTLAVPSNACNHRPVLPSRLSCSHSASFSFLYAFFLELLW